MLCGGQSGLTRFSRKTQENPIGSLFELGFIHAISKIDFEFVELQATTSTDPDRWSHSRWNLDAQPTSGWIYWELKKVLLELRQEEDTEGTTISRGLLYRK